MSTIACARCGQVHKLCTAHNAAGNPCGKSPVRGMTICSTHGGQAPQAKAARDRRESEEQARTFLGTLGIVEDPSKLPPVMIYAELQLSAATHVAKVRWLEQQVANIRVEDVPTSPWPKLLTEARRDADRLLVELGRQGIDLAMVRLEREKADAVVGVLRAVLTKLGLDPAAPNVVQIVTAELRALEGVA